MKCQNDDCSYCRILAPVRMAEEDFRNLKWLPDPTPEPGNEGGWMRYEEAYSQDTNDSARPSLKDKPGATEADMRNKKLFVAGEFRKNIICYS